MRSFHFFVRQAAEDVKSDFWLVLPAARYFFLGEKVPKTPHKGYPLMDPRLRGSPMVLVLLFAARGCRNDFAFATLPLQDSGFLISAFDLECLVWMHSTFKPA